MDWAQKNVISDMEESVPDQWNVMYVLDANGTTVPIQLFLSCKEEYIIWCKLSERINDPVNFWDFYGRVTERLQEDMGLYLQSLIPPADSKYFSQMVKSIIQCAYSNKPCLLVFDHIELLTKGFVNNLVLQLGQCAHQDIAVSYLDRIKHTIALHTHEVQPTYIDGHAFELLQLAGVKRVHKKTAQILEMPMWT